MFASLVLKSHLFYKKTTQKSFDIYQEEIDRYTGKHVDIVTLEAGSLSGSYTGYHDNHPDFDAPDNTGNTRCIPMDWNGCSSTSNNQVTSNFMIDAHAIGTLSAAGGIYGGIAKKAKLRASYTTDGLATVCNAIIHFHNNKSTNGTTGLKDPTIVDITDKVEI